MTKILIDTDIIIWLLKKNELYVKKFIDAQNEGYTFLLSPNPSCYQ